MPLTIKDKSTVPDDGWRYPGLDDHMIVTRNYSIFYDEVVEHYRNNGAEPPSREAVILYLCQELHIPCYDSSGPFANTFTRGLPAKVHGPRGCCSGAKK